MTRRETPRRPTALVTGASSGIGRELARVYAENGHHVVLVARRQDRLEALAAELSAAHGVRAIPIALDLLDPAAPEVLFDRTVGARIDIDVLVNNAGFGHFRDFLDTRMAEHASVVHLNVVALTQLTHLFLPEMIKRGRGSILNIASVAAFSPAPSAAVYGATKAYVLSLSQALAAELEGTGVTVTALCPGLTETEFSEVATGRSKPRALVPSMMKATARDVALAGYRAASAGEEVHINGLAYRAGIEWLRWQPRFVTRAFSRVLGRQLQSGF
ncbi:MAG: SDR family NAD(P)-dependent oxidoreductase [Alphaproteobacteria bacterium]|nr:SDR family NAD(P)-dependent oxidoreductase [Alphaproteobacteria bacterium]